MGGYTDKTCLLSFQEKRTSRDLLMGSDSSSPAAEATRRHLNHITFYIK